MADTPDIRLLEKFARNGSEDAFAALVQRHIGLVHSVALRHTANPHHAEDITQAVFIILARKAGTLNRKTVLPGWLYHTARLTAANWQRAEARRIRREQEVFMQSQLEVEESPTENLWRELSPQLDQAMASLGSTDRDALVLRYFQNKCLAEVGQSLGLTENAAQKRIRHALEKLRKCFSKCGMNSTVSGIANAISTHSVQSVPMALTKSATAVAVVKGAAASTSTLTLVKGALKVMAWTKAKTAIVAGVCLLLVAAMPTIVLVNEHQAHRIDKLWRINRDLAPDRIDALPPMVKIVPTKFASRWTTYNADANGGKWVGSNARLKVIVACAYGVPFPQIRFQTEVPTNRYDFIATLPHGSREALRQELKSKFGLVGHWVTENTNALLLEVQYAGAPGLQPPDGNSGAYLKEGVFHASDAPLGHGEGFQGMTDYLEVYFKMPIIDQTGIAQHFRIDLHWRENKFRDNPNGLKRSLLDQLGLKLVSTNMPIKMLVIEKAK